MPGIRRVLEAAIRAPSGDNAQPWRFVVHEGPETILEIWLDPDADTSFYNRDNHAAYFALGACVENICTAASSEGIHTQVAVFPTAHEKMLVARVVCTTCPVSEHPRARAIVGRVTNRHPYEIDALPESVLTALTEAGRSDETQVHITTKREDAKILGHIAATNEYVMLGDERLHRFFFEHINWTQEEDAKKQTGFFVASLALPPPALLGFKIARSWKRCSLLNTYLHFNKIVADQNAALYEQAAAFCCITTSEESPRAAFAAGRALEACWLEAQKQGLQVQPLMGTLFLRFASPAAGEEGLSPEAFERVKEGVSQLQSIFGYVGRKPYALFRVGKAKKEAVYTQRLSVDAVTTWK